MNYKVNSHHYMNTGGGTMVSIFEVYLPDENRTLFVTCDEEVSSYYVTDGDHVIMDDDCEPPVEMHEVIPQHKTLQQTLAACLYRLQATYMCNHEVMDAEDIGDLLTTIEDVKYYMASED